MTVLPLDGDLIMNTDGSFTYTPGRGFRIDSFEYEISDGELTDTARVTLENMEL